MINWFGFETPEYVPQGVWNRGYEALLDDLVEMGFDSIRLPFSADAVANPPITRDVHPDNGPPGRALDFMERIVTAAASRGLDVLLDYHRTTADQPQDYLPVRAGHGVETLVANWQAMARRFGGHPNVVGADIFNEPYRVASWPVWKGICERVGAAIQSIAPHWLIVVELIAQDSLWARESTGGVAGFAAGSVRLPVADRVVYSPHPYWHSVWLYDWLQYAGHPVAGWPDNLRRRYTDNWGFLVTHDLAPLLCGEFGGHLGYDPLTGAETMPHAAEERQALATFLRYIDGDFDGDGFSDLPEDHPGLSAAYWNQSPFSPDTGGLVLPDFVTRQAGKLALLERWLKG